MSKDKYVEQYRRLSPIERNQQLKQLYGSLPDWDVVWHVGENMPGEQIREGIKKRELSQTANILRNRLDAFLSLAPRIRSCKIYLSGDFNMRIKYGLDRQDVPEYGLESQLSHYSRMLGWDDPLSAGIFEEDPVLGANIERGMYHRLVKAELNQLSLFESPEELAEMGEILNQVNTEMSGYDRKKVIYDWRREFIEKYGDEP